MTKEELREYRSIKNELCQIELKLQEVERYELEPEVVRPLRALYRDKLAELIERQLDIEEALECLSSTERMLMRLRYFEGKEWLDICEAIHYEWTQTHRIHARALKKIQDL